MYIAKVTFNTKSWSKPSGSEGKLIGNNFVSFYEDISGFGWEEWNFNVNRKFENNYYGFLQAIHNSDSLRGKTYKDVYLFTQTTNLKYFLVGHIKEVRALRFSEASSFRNSMGHISEMREDIISINGNLKSFTNDFNICINSVFIEPKLFFNTNESQNLQISIPNRLSSFKNIFELTNQKKIDEIISLSKQYL